MSRSKKHTAKTGITMAGTENENKRKANRKLRRKTKEQVKKRETTLSQLREVSDVWTFNKKLSMQT